MSQLEVNLKEIRTTARYGLVPYYAEPTLEIIGTIRCSNDLQVGLARIQCDIRLATSQLISLANVPVYIINIPKKTEDPKEFNILFSFSLDSSNAVQSLIKTSKLSFNDKINFDIQLSGFSMDHDNFEPINFNRGSHNLELHVVDYMNLLSTPDQRRRATYKVGFTSSLVSSLNRSLNPIDLRDFEVFSDKLR